MISTDLDFKNSRKVRGGVLFLLTLLVVNLSLSALTCLTYQEFDDQLFSQPLQIEDISGKLVHIPISACNFPGQGSSSKEDQKSPLDCDFCVSQNSIQEISSQTLVESSIFYRVEPININSTLISRVIKGDRQSRAPPTLV